ncbi:MAG TPA: hypothetical protein VIL46_05650, partial [Gemmataceae bacterium]
GWWPRPDFSARTWAAVAIGALTASGPAYYAFFGCYLFLVAGGYGWSRTGSARPLLSGAALAALTVGVGVVNALPAIAYEQRYGANPEAKWRAPEEAETYGLKVVQMILPVDDHRAPALARLKAAYNSTYRPLQNENETATLGLVGAAGFLALLGIALFRVRTRAPLPGALAALTLAAVLLGTIGGLGSAFNFLVYPQIRAYNRISVYIAFFSLLGLLWLLEAALHYRPHPRLGKGRVGAVVARLGAWVLFPGLMLLGLWDQVTWRPSSPATAGQEAQARERFEHDRAFVRRIEAALPRGAMVFQLPYAHYPEHTGQHRMGHYAHLRLYLHSASLRWSFGAMRGREVDQWQQRVASQPPEEMLKALVLAGFGGLTIDRRGYADSASGLEAEVRRLLGAEPVVSPDGERAFYPLGEFARRLRAEYSPEEWERQREAACEPLCLLWQEGFFRLDDPAKADPYRVGRKHSRLTVVNPSGRPRRARLRMVLGARDADRAELRISGALFGERVALTRAPELLEKELVVPPGRHAVFFDCEPSADYRPWDSRRGVFFVGSCTLEEPGGRETALPRAEQADSPGDR